MDRTKCRSLTVFRVILFFVFISFFGCVSTASLHANLGTNLAASKKYEWSRKPNAFPNGYNGKPMCMDVDDRLQLTDGELADKGWWDSRSVGWWSDERVDITIDLAEEKAVDAVAFHLWSEKEGGRVPRQVLVFSSNDNKSFYYAGKMTSDETMMQWDQGRQMKKDGDNPHCWIVKKNLHTRGRYITLSFWATSLYLDEIKLFSGGLSLDAVKLDEEKKVNSIDIHPFVGYDKLYVAREICLPVFLTLSQEMQDDPMGGLSVYVDLPDGILLKGPQHTSEPEKIVEGDKQWMRYKLTKARFIFLQSRLATDTKSLARIMDAEPLKGKVGRIQNVEIETISIPKAPLPRKLRVSVGFAPLAFWLKWPEVLKNYKHLGLNVFLPFCHADPYWVFVQNNSRTPQAKALIRAAKEAGLIVGAWTSPFCNNAIIRSDKEGTRKAVFLGSGKLSEVPCPRVYLDRKNGSAWWGRSEITQVEKGVAEGIEFYLFDSEPSWGGPICACQECEEHWKRFLNKRGVTYRGMNEIWTLNDNKKSKDRRDYRLLQEFWDEFYCELWGAFRSRMDKAVPKNSAVVLGLYNYPQHSNYQERFLGEHGRFLPLFNKGIVSFAAPENYLARTQEYGSIIRTWRQKLPNSCPIYPIVSCGAMNMVACERSATDLRHRLFEIFCNGGQGFHCWSIGGATGDDLQAIAQVINAVYPYEDLIVLGQPIPKGVFSTPDTFVNIDGIRNGKEALILVSRYNKQDSAKVKVRFNSRKLGFNVVEFKTVFNAEKVRIDHNGFNIEFDGSPEDSVKVFYIKSRE
jgi:hypothetical protein